MMVLSIRTDKSRHKVELPAIALLSVSIMVLVQGHEHDCRLACWEGLDLVLGLRVSHGRQPLWWCAWRSCVHVLVFRLCYVPVYNSSTVYVNFSPLISSFISSYGQNTTNRNVPKCTCAFGRSTDWTRRYHQYFCGRDVPDPPPRHLLFRRFSMPCRKVVLYPTHNLVLAAHCAHLHFLPASQLRWCGLLCKGINVVYEIVVYLEVRIYIASSLYQTHLHMRYMIYAKV